MANNWEIDQRRQPHLTEESKAPDLASAEVHKLDGDQSPTTRTVEDYGATPHGQVDLHRSWFGYLKTKQFWVVLFFGQVSSSNTQQCIH